MFSDNRCEDWGYLEDNTTIVASPATRRSFTANGARNLTLNNNSWRMVGLPTNNHRAIHVRNYTDIDGGTWTAGAIMAEGNSFQNVERPIVEEAGVTQSMFEVLVQGGVASVYDQIAHNSVVRVRGIGATGEAVRIGNAGIGASGGTEVYAPALRIYNDRRTGAFTSTVTSLAAGAASTVTVNVAGAAVGDLVVLSPINSAALNPEVLAKAAVTSTDTVTIQLRNNGTVNRDLSTWQWILEVNRT